ncbi:MAG TPA: TRIC cation channel family protein [Casimicrobiaceae bacterium]
MPALNTDLVLQTVEAAAVVVSAIAGMIVAADKRMDLIGAYALACVNAFGGGTVRDLLLDNRPFYWMANWGYLLAILLIAIPFVYSVRMFRIASAVHRRSIKTDAVGLALFTITGVGIALQRDAPVVVAVLMGVVAGTTGGVLRDVVVNELPDLFRPGGLYASASFMGGVAFVVALRVDLAYANAALIGVGTVVLLRLVSVRLGLGIPAPQWIDRDRAGNR